MRQWMAVEQTPTLLDYWGEFINMANPLERVPQRILMAQFLKWA